jgi:hypothetical protein
MTVQEVIPVLQVILNGLNIVIGLLTIVQSFFDKNDLGEGKSTAKSN